ncbi:hypothetical protein [Sphingomonas elodea]|uniref:Lipase (Class 3) n=1 Tax=Sphingomonas elodea TaxID=179878 RepID=Q7X2N5_SPHEL|nr:hypothetical protein [Sphingomonas elodea]AAP46183.1 hypothetical protein [Sphingomonas elodea ATCC 31461]
MYDLTQTSFLFSVYANAASSIEGTAPQLAGLLGLALDQGGSWSNGTQTYAVRGLLNEIGGQLYGGDWEVAWGPAVYQPANTRYAANAMAVLYSKALDLHVVATAGTNMDDIYDWFREDLPLGPNAMVDFPVSLATPPKGGAANGTVPQVSLGTAQGIYDLLVNMVDQNGVTVSLLDYLSGLTPGIAGTSTILFVGHSLGGALSATLPLQVLATIKDWAWTAQGGKVDAMPTAAPTPGNQLFSNLWASQLQPVPVAGTAAANQVTALNVPIEDAVDLVPHAWTNIFAETQDPSDPYYFFDSTLIPPTLGSLTVKLGGLLAPPVALAARAAQQNGEGALIAKLPNVQQLQPSFPISYWNAATQAFASYSLPPAPVTDIPTFKTMLFMVHVWQYFQFFGITTSALPYPITAQQSGKAAAGTRLAATEQA